jgi:hypothetical protein
MHVFLVCQGNSRPQRGSWLLFGLFKGQIIQIWPSLKRVAREEMIWSFFLAFLNVEESTFIF